jgi:hypothetical protein
MKFTWRFKKIVTDSLDKEDLPKPTTEVIRITPSGFPAKEDAVSKFSHKKSENTNDPGLLYLPDLMGLLILFSMDIGVPGPFAPLPPSAVEEGDQWNIERPTPFVNTKGGRLEIQHATAYTYPSMIKVIGKKDVKGRPVLQVQETYDQEINIPVGDTLFDLVRLLGRTPPKGTIRGRVKCTTDYYYALSDGALVLSEGKVDQKLRAEYDPDTVKEWEVEDPWAEWDVKTTFRQALAEDKTPATVPIKPTPKKKK